MLKTIKNINKIDNYSKQNGHRHNLVHDMIDKIDKIGVIN